MNAKEKYTNFIKEEAKRLGFFLVKFQKQVF